MKIKSPVTYKSYIYAALLWFACYMVIYMLISPSGEADTEDAKAEKYDSSQVSDESIPCQTLVEFSRDIMLFRQTAWEIEETSQMLLRGEPNPLVEALIQDAYLIDVKETASEKIDAVMEFQTSVLYACETHIIGE